MTRPRRSVIDVTRGHSTVTREALAEWEIRTFSAPRAQRDATTPFDNEIPENPLDHLDEFRSALVRLGIS